jgi:glutamate-1-semialdehyde 2,1-aminomutase
VSMAATLATIRELEKETVYRRLFRLGEEMRKQLDEVISDLRIKAQTVGFGSVFQILFTDTRIRDYRDVLTSDTKKFREFQRGMMDKGVFILPHANKRSHLCAAHTEEDVRLTVESAREILGNMQKRSAK